MSSQPRAPAWGEEPRWWDYLLLAPIPASEAMASIAQSTLPHKFHAIWVLPLNAVVQGVAAVWLLTASVVYMFATMVFAPISLSVSGYTFDAMLLSGYRGVIAFARIAMPTLLASGQTAQPSS